MRTRQIGPGFVQQMQCQCPDCDGTGASLCRGYQVKQKKELLVVEILKGPVCVLLYPPPLHSTNLHRTSRRHSKRV